MVAYPHLFFAAKLGQECIRMPPVLMRSWPRLYRQVVALSRSFCTRLGPGVSGHIKEVIVERFPP